MGERDITGLRLDTLESERKEIKTTLSQVHDAVLIMQHRRIVEGGEAPLCASHTILLGRMEKKIDVLNARVWKGIGVMLTLGFLLTFFAPDIRKLIGLGTP